MLPEIDFEYVDTAQHLDICTRSLAKAEILGVDIEADSLHHYIPKVCLIQISDGCKNIIIDPLAVGNIDPLSDILSGKKILKVLHGADYDIRSLFRDYSIELSNFFDTMIGTRFLGKTDIGLAAVLKERFGIELDKKYQKADWSKRPLPAPMLSYAAHDTAHLPMLYSSLRQELIAMDRIRWAEEECAYMADGCIKSIRGQQQSTQNETAGALSAECCGQKDKDVFLARKFKGASVLSRRDLAVLENLLELREQKAIQYDKPPFKIVSNKTIGQLLTEKPCSRKALHAVIDMPSGFAKRYGAEVVAAIRGALHLPENQLPVYPRGQRVVHTKAFQARSKRLKAWRAAKAEKLQLDCGLVCSNMLLETISDANPLNLKALRGVPGIRRWQRELFGQEIVDVLNVSD